MAWNVEIRGLAETLDALGRLDPLLKERVNDRIREVARPTLAKAKGYASGLGTLPTGHYAASLSLRKRKSGVVFASSDPGAGVIEFANPGAVILTGPLRGRRAGVPHGSHPPRALLRAILEDEEQILQSINEAVQEACDTVGVGDLG